MTPRPLIRQDIDCVGLHPDTRVPVPDVDKFSTGWAYARDLGVGDRVFTASGDIASIIGTHRTPPRKVLKVTFSDRQVIRCGSGQQFEAQSPGQRVREGKSGGAGRNARQHLTNDRDEFRKLAAHSALVDVISAPELHRLTRVSLQRVLQALAEAGVARTKVRRLVPSEHERRRSLMVKVYPSESLWDALRESRLDVGIPPAHLPTHITVREAVAIMELAPTPRVLDSVRGVVDRRNVPFERVRRDVVDGQLNRMMDVYVYNRREALLAVAAQREAILGRLPQDWTWVTARTVESSIRTQRWNSRLTWSIATADLFDLPDRDVCIPPWLLGFWLGDGDHDNYQFTVGNEDRESLVPMIEHSWSGPVGIRELSGKVKVSLRTRDPAACFQGHPRVDRRPCYECLTLYEYKGLHRPRPGVNAPFVRLLRHLRVFKNKHVPAAYLRSSASQRLAIVQGLMDSDGHVTVDGKCELTFSDQRLASDALDLIRSLGIRASCTTGPTHRTTHDGVRVPGKERYRIHFTTTTLVASLPRKASRLKGADSNTAAQRRLFIESVITTDEETELIALAIDGSRGVLLVEGFLPVRDSRHHDETHGKRYSASDKQHGSRTR